MKEGWEYKKLGEVVYYPTERIPSTNIDGSNYVGVDNLIKDRGGKETATIIPSEGNCIKYRAGDVLIGNIRPYLKKIWLADNNGGASGDVLVLRAKDEHSIFSDYLYWCLSNDSFFEFDMLHSKGAKMPRGSKVDIMKYVIPIPSISQQKQISSELNSLNGIIKKTKAQLEELDKLAQSIFYDMFEGKEWDKKLIRNIAIVKIGPFGSALHKHDYISGGTPLVNPIHMVNGKIIADNDFTIDDNKKRELSAYLLKKNDIVFGRRGDIGRCALVTKKEDGYICGTGSLFVRFNIDINPIYSLLQLSSIETKNYLMDNARGATMLNLNSGVVEGITISLPPLSLQQEFASKIEAIESMEAKVRQSLTEAETLFNSRMDYYFN